MTIEVGAVAPDFQAKIDGDNDLSLSNYKGKWVVLYFYPKDNTSGCTKEACAFKDNMEVLTGHGTDVLGVSPDSVKSHNNFKEKYELNFNLIADTEKEISELYGAFGEKKMYGKTYMGVIRSTFLIDPDGIIRYIWKNVKVNGHVEKVIEKLIELQSAS